MQILTFMYMIAALPMTLLGLVVAWHIIRPQRAPADRSNRLGKARAVWDVLRHEDELAELERFAYLRGDVGDWGERPTPGTLASLIPDLHKALDALDSTSCRHGIPYRYECEECENETCVHGVPFRLDCKACDEVAQELPFITGYIAPCEASNLALAQSRGENRSVPVFAHPTGQAGWEVRIPLGEKDDAAP